MPYILAHDLGTTGNKASLFDGEGRLCGARLESYPVEYPQPNWAEQDPADWWRAVCRSTQALLEAVPAAAQEIAAVSFSGQMMGVVALDAQDRALRPAIIWADQRAVEEAEWIAARCGMDEVYRRTGHRVSPAYTAAKILWIKNHQPDLYAQTAKFLMAKDYIVLRLTSEAVTDFSDASGSNLFDIQTRAWCRDFLGQLGLEEERLPRVCASTRVAGHVTPAASEATGLAAGTPVVIGGGDGACATVGAGVVEPGDCYCYIGSSAWVSLASEQPVFDPQMRTFTFPHLHPSRYTPMGTMQAAGGARDWLLRVVGEVSDADIAQAPPGADGLLFLPYLIGERSPWWNPNARGSFVGLTMRHTRAEMGRAVLEGVAFNLNLIVEALESQGSRIAAVRLIGGGARSPVWPQILASAFGKPIHIPDLVAEATSWGAAVAGGIGVGLYRDWGIAKERTRVKAVVEPEPAQAERYAELYPLFADTYRALEPIYNRMQKQTSTNSTNSTDLHHGP
jgi:xylulokinase